MVSRSSQIYQGQPGCSFSPRIDPPEKLSTVLHIPLSSVFLKHLDRAQGFGFCPFKPALLTPNPCLQLHRASQVVWAVVRKRLGVSEVSICVVEPVFVEKQSRQGVTNPKQLVVPAERGRNSEGYFVMVSGLLCSAPGRIYIAQTTVTSADQKLIAFLGEKINCAGRGFRCGIELVVPMQQPSKGVQTLRLSHCVVEPFVYFQRFFRLWYPFPVEPKHPVCIR